MINLAWLKACKNDDERKKVAQIVENSELVLDKLSEMCYNTILENQKVKPTDYDTAGWAYKQAHLNGESAALRKIIDICKTKERP